MFWRSVRGFFLSIFFVLVSVTAVHAQSPVPSPAVEDALEMLVEGPIFVAEDTVILDKVYTGGVFAAGGEVRFSGIVDGDLVVAGGSVILSGEVTGDVYAAGGTVIVEGLVDGNVIAAGGEVRLADTAEVGGSFISAGERVQSLGTIASKLYAAGKTVDLGGFVSGSAWVEAQDIRSEDQIEVSGDRNFTERPQEETVQSENRLMQIPVDFVTGFLWRAVLFLVVFFTMKPLLEKGSQVVVQKPVATLLNGIAALVLIPIVLVFLTITVIAFPVAVVMVFTLGALASTGWMFLAHALGRKIWSEGKGWLQGLIGVALLALLSAVPVVHWFAFMVEAAWGVGIWFLTLRLLAPTAVLTPALASKKPRSSKKRSAK